VQLAIAKALFGTDTAFSRRYGHCTVFNFPFHCTSLIRFPSGGAFAVKQNDGIAGGSSTCSRSYFGGDGPPYFGGLGVLTGLLGEGEKAGGDQEKEKIQAFHEKQIWVWERKLREQGAIRVPLHAEKCTFFNIHGWKSSGLIKNIGISIFTHT
jgi:hypothetical protein